MAAGAQALVVDMQIVRNFRSSGGVPLLMVTAASSLLWRMRVVGPRSVPLDWFGNSDQYLYFYPVYRFFAERLKEGKLPMWNPAQLAGVPFLATAQAGVFYPPNLLHVLLPSERAMEALAFGHLLLASLLVYSLCRVLGACSEASALGGISYGWSTYLVGAHLWPPGVAGLAWFPLPLIGIALIQRGRIGFGTACLAIGTATIVLIGHLPLGFYGLQATAAYAAWNITRRWPQAGAQAKGLHVLIVGFAAVAGVLLSAPQWLPTLELSRLGTRNPAGLTPLQVEPFGPMPWALVGQLFAPSVRGSAYGGAATLLLLPVAIVARRLRSEAIFFVCLAFFFALVALGSATPVFALYSKLPGTGLFRGPSRALCLFTLGTSVTGAIGADGLLARPRMTLPLRWGVSVGTVGTALILWMIPLKLPTVALVCSTLAISGCVCLPDRWRRPALAVVGGILVADLATIPATPDVQIWRPGALEQLNALQPLYCRLASAIGQGRVIISPSIAYPVATSPRVAGMHGLRVFEDYEPLTTRRYADYATFLQHGRLYQPEKTAIPYAGALEPQAGIRHRRLLSAAGVRALVSVRDGTPPRLDVARVDDAFLRAYVVHGLTPARDTAATLSSIASGAVGPETVVLEHLPAAAARSPSPLVGGEGARITRDEPELVTVDAMLERPGALVLLDADYPGWRASVDGEETRIYNANSLFRAVVLNPGHHRVRFWYAPQSLYVGLGLACVGALLLAVFCSVFRFRSGATVSFRHDAPPTEEGTGAAG